MPLKGDVDGDEALATVTTVAAAAAVHIVSSSKPALPILWATASALPLRQKPTSQVHGSGPVVFLNDPSGQRKHDASCVEK
jgi:hypothetical protein